jgi:hypothetical protein
MLNIFEAIAITVLTETDEAGEQLKIMQNKALIAA